jgi:hypothetical protein
MHYTISRPQEKRKAQPGAEAASAAACAIGTSIGLHGQKRILRTSDLVRGGQEKTPTQKKT